MTPTRLNGWTKRDDFSYYRLYGNRLVLIKTEDVATFDIERSYWLGVDMEYTIEFHVINTRQYKDDFTTALRRAHTLVMDYLSTYQEPPPKPSPPNYYGVGRFIEKHDPELFKIYLNEVAKNNQADHSLATNPLDSLLHNFSDDSRTLNS